MPRISDLSRVRALLDRDRGWAAYALGDLSPGFVEHCEWHAAGEESDALLLVYRGYSPPITFAMGPCADLAALFAEIDPAAISLHLRPESIDAMRDSYVPTHTRAMWRMVLPAASFAPADDSAVREVDEGSRSAVLDLYDDGHRRGEGPTFFHPAMLRQGTFRGVWEDGALVSIAGTHLFSADLGVCAVGNVYTRADRRGRGLGARVTSSVVRHALALAIPTIVLNVGHDNPGARRVYERLGFRCYCDFLEGEATRTALDK